MSDASIAAMLRQEAFSPIDEALRIREEARNQTGKPTGVVRGTVQGSLVGGFAESLWSGKTGKGGMVLGGFIGLHNSLKSLLNSLKTVQNNDRICALRIIISLDTCAARLLDQCVSLVYGAAVDFSALNMAQIDVTKAVGEAAEVAKENFLLFITREETIKELESAKNAVKEQFFATAEQKARVVEVQAKLDDIEARLGPVQPGDEITAEERAAASATVGTMLASGY